MSYPGFGVRASQSCLEWFAYSKCAIPFLLLATLALCPTAELCGQSRTAQTPSHSNFNSRKSHPLDPVPKLIQFKRKIAQTLFGSPPRMHDHRPPAFEHNNSQTMPDHGHYRTPYRAERIGTVRNQRVPIGFHEQNRLLNYQQDQDFQEPISQGNEYHDDQRWSGNDIAPPRNNFPAQSAPYGNPAQSRYSPLDSTTTYPPQDSRLPAMNQNRVEELPAHAADSNFGYPANSLRSPTPDPGFRTEPAQYGSSSSARQQPNSGGHMGAGTRFQGKQLTVGSATATEHALHLKSEVDELEKRVAFLEKVNDQLRQRIKQYDNVTSQTTTEMNQATRQLIQADESNQKLLQRIAFLEVENQKIRLESARVLDSIKHNLDDLLLRELKDSSAAGQPRRDQ